MRPGGADAGAGADAALLAWGPDQPASPGDRVGGKRRHAHRHDRPLGGRQWPDRGQELIGSRSIDDAQDGVAAGRQAQCPLAQILGLLVTFHEPAADQAVNQAAGRRGRPTDGLGKLPHGQGAAVGQDIEARQLGETEPQLPELAGKADDQLAPESPTHRHSLTDLPNVGQPVAGGQDGR